MPPTRWPARTVPDFRFHREDERHRARARAGQDALHRLQRAADPTAYSTYSTAHDLVDLGRAAMRNTTFATIVATRSYRVAATSAHRAHTGTTSTRCSAGYTGTIGIKTGYTSAAGQCFLFEARRGSTTLIGVVLDSSPDITATLATTADATAMLDWGFSR